MIGLLHLAPETLDHIAAYLDPGDASSLSVTHPALQSPGQRSLFADVVFLTESDDGRGGESFLKFLLAILTRPALGIYVTSLAVDTLNTSDPDEFVEAFEKLDHVWQHLPALKHLSLTPTPFVPLTFVGCTNSLLSLRTRYCTDTVHRLLLRNRGLLRLSFTNDCRDIYGNRHACFFSRDALPRLRQICADLGTYSALASTRSISHISHCSFPNLEQFAAAAPMLSRTPGPLLKLNLFLTVGRNQSALLDNWRFMAPLQRHFATLTSLSFRFNIPNQQEYEYSQEYAKVHGMCRSLPTALASLRTLRLWLPVRLQDTMTLPRVHVQDFNDELEFVDLAHRRCPSLRHVSLFHRIDWHRVQSGDWVPLTNNRLLNRAARKWFAQNPERAELFAQHAHELEAAETDSLVSLPDQDPDYEPGFDDDRGSDADVDWDALADEVLELGNEEALLPPPGSDIPRDVWQEMVNDPSHAGWGRESISPLTGDNIAALLEQIDDAAHRAQCELRR